MISVTDSLLYGWGKKAIAFSLNSTPLIRTLYMALSVSALMGFDCALPKLSANGLNYF